MSELSKGVSEASSMSVKELRRQKLMGEALREFREGSGLTRAEVAAKMGPAYTEDFVTRYEEGEVPMEATSVFALLDALGTTMHDIDPARPRKTRLVPDEYLALSETHRGLVDRVIMELARKEPRKA